MSVNVKNGVLSTAERQGVEWLAARRKWEHVTVLKSTSAPYDIEVVFGIHSMQFMRECLREFFDMGIFGTGVGYKTSEFVAGLPAPAVRMEFDRVLKLAESKPLFSRELISAVWATWGDISPDAGRCSNAEAIELVLDADRLSTFGYKAAYNELNWLDARFGYERVSKALAREVRLV